MPPINHIAILLTLATFLGLGVTSAQSASTTVRATTKPAPPPPRYPINPALPTLWIIGDSTVRCGHDHGEGGMWGWGTPLAEYFDLSKINIQNLAVGGTSSRTFRSSGFWEPILAKIKPGDLLMMQFGHNDASKVNDNARARGTLPGIGDDSQEIDNELTGQHETVHSYGWYLRQYIAEAREKGVKEIFICSPVPKNAWKGNELSRGWNASYVRWAKELAEQSNVHFIPLNDLASAKFESLGPAAVTEQLFPPKEVIHTAWAGAVLNAQCVLSALKEAHLPTIDGALLTPAPTDIRPPSTAPAK